MSRIHVLSAHLVNKIAAGEVIERPASVVKELVENAVDAGATRVDVAVERGGRQLITVSDNGAGMSPQDLALAFVPHATSKILSDEDLFRIGTMGFRGEALASIASVSHAHMRTRRREDQAGSEVAASGEELGEVRPVAAAAGTTITIRDLFFSTPARRKFLKTDTTEFGHVSETLTRLALPRPEVAFTLSHNGRGVLSLPAGQTLVERIRAMFGDEIADDLIPVTPTHDAISAEGLIGTPAAARASARWQYLFLNGRYIRDRSLSHALKEAYRGLMDPSRQPVAFLFLRVPPEDVDVNVHPTKIEVRFRDTQSVHAHLLAALRETLQQADLRPAASLPSGATGGADLPEDERRQSLRQALADFFKSQSPAQGHLQFPQRPDRPERPERRPEELDPRPAHARPPLPSSEPLLPHGSPDPFRPPLPRTVLPEPAPPTAEAPSEPPGTGTGPEVLQVHNTYLVVHDPEGLLIVDQHALHERILYEQLRTRIAEGTLEGQRLLLPATVNVTPGQHALLVEHADLLVKLGIEVTDFGPGTVAIHRFPTFLNKLDPAAFLVDALDRLAEGDLAVEPEHLLHELLDIMACKAAVKAGDPLTHEEIRALLARREDVAKSTACPHGRPTQIRLTLRDLEKQFKRV